MLVVSLQQCGVSGPIRRHGILRHPPADVACVPRGHLAVPQVEGWTDVLATQLARIKTPDRKQRSEFVMPALSAGPVERERWFLFLSDVNNRWREYWGLEGLGYLHHPLRAETSKKFISPSLDMLWDIQKTGDISFPTNWLDASLSGHQTRAVADTVHAFLTRTTRLACGPSRCRAPTRCSAPPTSSANRSNWTRRW